LNHFCQLPIDIGNFLYPVPPLSMFQLENLRERPVKVIGYIGYLLVELVEGVARYSPG
jgi:hypothetical protein